MNFFIFFYLFSMNFFAFLQNYNDALSSLTVLDQNHKEVINDIYSDSLKSDSKNQKGADIVVDERAALRCGWFENPSPANAWLTDREAEWTVGVQGGHQAEGDWPKFLPGQWVKTNNNYGYGCACLRVKASKTSQEITKIISAYSKPLAACRTDSKLKEPATIN